jgi:transmembrane protein 107
MKISDSLISARFITTFGHFTALLILFSTVENNVEKSFADNDISSKADALAYANGALIFGCFCFVLDFSGIFFGNSLFMPSMNLFHVIFHATGSILLSWLITNNWYVSALWPIILCTNLPTALMELSIIIGIYGLKVISR